MNLFGPHTFLEDDVEAGILETWKWLMARFGDAKQMAWDPLILPTADFFPATTLKGDELAADILLRVRRLLKAEVECEILQLDARDLTPDEEGPPLITYSDATDPCLLVSELAHGVAALMLDPLRDELPEGPDSFWPATSLLVVHKGFGIFATDAALELFGGGQYRGARAYRSGYLTEPAFAFAFAAYLALTNRVGAADRWIKPACLGLLHDAQKYLAKNPGLLRPLKASP